MSFFKKVVRGLFGSGQSAQTRAFNEDWASQMALKTAEGQAQAYALQSQARLMDLQDQMSLQAQKEEEERMRMNKLKVEAGTAGARNFFKWGG